MVRAQGQNGSSRGTRPFTLDDAWTCPSAPRSPEARRRAASGAALSAGPHPPGVAGAKGNELPRLAAGCRSPLGSGRHYCAWPLSSLAQTFPVTWRQRSRGSHRRVHARAPVTDVVEADDVPQLVLKQRLSTRPTVPPTTVKSVVARVDSQGTRHDQQSSLRLHPDRSCFRGGGGVADALSRDAEAHQYRWPTSRLAWQRLEAPVRRRALGRLRQPHAEAGRGRDHPHCGLQLPHRASWSGRGVHR